MNTIAVEGEKEKKERLANIEHGEAVNFRDSWRVFKIVSEFVEGYQLLSDLTKEVTILGSARLPRNNKYYKIAEDFGKLLAKNGFTTITGGGPGIMEAANKGAYEAHGPSIGLNIQLPTEQRINPFVKVSAGFYYFFTRKVMLTSPANAFVFFPGGFGTLDELFEVLDYMKMGSMETSPIVLVGVEFWRPLVNFLKEKCAGTLHSLELSEIERWHVVDTAEEAFALIRDTVDRPNVCIPSPNDPFCQSGTDWRIFRMMAELVEGFEFVTGIQNDVTVIGTKHLSVGSPYYDAGYELGTLLAEAKMTVITGGGKGVAEAVNKGSFEHGGESVGISMVYEGQNMLNPYITKSKGFFFPFIRKLMIASPSKAFVFFPGGLGTLHQLFEILTLQETKKMDPVPTILFGSEFWNPLLDFIHTLHNKFATITELDEEFIKVVDDPKEVLAYVKGEKK